MTGKPEWQTLARAAMVRWKYSQNSLPPGARAKGTYFFENNGREEKGAFPFCLPKEFAVLNLLPGVRDEALQRFRHHRIAWNAWTPAPNGARWPTGHLVSSQVQCVNVLLELAKSPAELLAVARLVEPTAERLVPIEDGSPVAFEWIGQQNYLGERGWGERGRFATSGDALVAVERRDGGRTGILKEWKFTEVDAKPVEFHGPGGTDRRALYGPLYGRPGNPFAHRPDIEAFFVQVHYQLLRLALLAEAMVQAREFGIDRAIVLHVVPKANVALRQNVPVSLSKYGTELDEVWRNLLPGPTVRYACVDSTALFVATPDLAERYGAVAEVARALAVEQP